MPNYCNYRMKIAGRRDNVNAFIQIMKNEDYTKPHLYRVFEADLEYTEDYGLWMKAYVSGYCAWSVYSCMFPGPATYYGDDNNAKRQRYYEEQPDNYVIGTNIIKEARRLALTIEIYSEEPGMCFQEWYRVVCGEWVLDKSGEYNEWYLGEWNSYQDMQNDLGEDYKIPFTEEEFKQAKLYDGECWTKREFEEPDTIPDNPVRLTKDVLYKVVDKNDK